MASTKVSAHIPDDLAFSILSKLPLKSLKRFICIQKSWSLLFENSHFMNMFRKYFLSKHHSFYDDTCFLLNKITETAHATLYMLSDDSFEDRIILDWPPLFQENPQFIEILGSSSVNGNLCIYQKKGNDSIIVIWNPAIGQFKVIPPTRYPFENDVFNPPPEGFGYDSVRNDYKLLRSAQCPSYLEDHWNHVPEKDDCFWNLNEEDMYYDVQDSWWDDQVDYMFGSGSFWEIYSLKENSWKKLDGVNCPFPSGSSLMVNTNEVSHWLDIEGVMVSFDFTNEIFFATTSSQEKYMNRRLVMLNGSVALIRTPIRTYDDMNTYDDMDTNFHIWILGELGVNESWTKLFVVQPLTSFIHNIGGLKNGNIFFRKKYDEFARFDLSTQRIEEIDVKGGINLQIVLYKENILPIEGMDN